MNKIVVVEDQEEYLIKIVELLRRKGYAEAIGVPVFKTDNCHRVVGQIKLLNPDLILMDERLTQTLRGHDVLVARRRLI
jgi:CheY-like chemotaxis protein